MLSSRYRKLQAGPASACERSKGALAGLIATPLPTNPAPNTTVSVPGVATITLNKQVSSGGSLEVDALSVELLGGTQTITVGTSVCNAADLSAG